MNLPGKRSPARNSTLYSRSSQLAFFALYTALAAVASRINFSALVGAKNQFFTLFQFFGPIAGGILGPLFGPLSVLAASATGVLTSLASTGARPDTLTLLRLLPMVVAAWYFGSRKGSLSMKLSLAVPAACIALFLLHPVGRQVWFYSLFWTIPILAALFHQRLFAKSLGATFTAHAVGGALWIWTVPMSPEAWVGLIPVVIYERLLFAAGIAASFVAATTLLSKLESRLPWLEIDKRYVLSPKLVQNL